MYLLIFKILFFTFFVICKSINHTNTTKLNELNGIFEKYDGKFRDSSFPRKIFEAEIERITDLITQLEQIKKQINSKSKENKDLNIRYHLIEKDISDLKLELKENEANKERIIEKNDFMKEKINFIDKSNELLKNIEIKTKETNEKLKNSLNKNSDKQRIVDQEIVTLYEEIKKLKEENKNIDLDIENKKEKFNDLIKNMKNTELQNKFLIEKIKEYKNQYDSIQNNFIGNTKKILFSKRENFKKKEKFKNYLKEKKLKNLRIKELVTNIKFLKEMLTNLNKDDKITNDNLKEIDEKIKNIEYETEKGNTEFEIEKLKKENLIEELTKKNNALRLIVLQENKKSEEIIKNNDAKINKLKKIANKINKEASELNIR